MWPTGDRQVILLRHVQLCDLIDKVDLVYLRPGAPGQLPQTWQNKRGCARGAPRAYKFCVVCCDCKASGLELDGVLKPLPTVPVVCGGRGFSAGGHGDNDSDICGNDEDGISVLIGP